MLDLIWIIMIVSALFFSIVNGTVSEVSAALLSGSKSAVSIVITLVGTMAFWLGITEIAVECGLTVKLKKLLMPIINLLFPDYKHNEDIKEKISLNFAANLLGLGNAATPLGLAAMDAMEKADGKRSSPSKGMVLFVVINTTSLQLLPTQMAALRSTYGSLSPFGILTPILITSLGTMVFAIILCKLMERNKYELDR